jgi:tetratricopeptide (TPR) repeat protein
VSRPVLPFVGRQNELARLESALLDALDAQARVILLAGEPGIGKSRIVSELARRAGARARVIVGRCELDAGAPAYWPWIQVLRAAIEILPADDLAVALGPGAVDLAPFLPELREQLPGVSVPPPADAAQARFRLFDAIARVLERISGEMPLLLVLDDLHAADPPSLLCLRFLARQSAAARLLLVATYRDTEAESALRDTIVDLLRELHVERLTLAGLDAADTGRLIEAVAGFPVAPALVRRLHADTQGNPFFVSEIVRLLAAEDRLGDVARTPPTLPPSVRAVLERRVARLPPPAPRALAVAAVLGFEVDLGVLGRVLGLEVARLLDALAPALDTQVVTPVPGAPGRIRFAHGLVRETLYQALAPTERMGLHACVVEVLEALHCSQIELYLPELAHHAYLAAPAGSPDRALDYALRAARRALMLVAPEEAVGHYERALGLLPLVAPEDAERRVELRLALGDAQTRAGQTASARDTFQGAAEEARVIGAAADFARAVLGWGQRWLDPVGATPALLRALEEALALLPAGDSSLRARVTACLGRLLYASPDRARRAALAERALAMARRLDEPATVSAVLFDKRHTVWGPDNLDERLAEATEMIQLAEVRGDGEMALVGHMLRAVDLLERGDLADVDRELLAQAALPAELRHPLYRHYALVICATRARVAGRLDEAERLALEALELGERARNPIARPLYAAHAADVLCERGGLETLEPAFRSFAEGSPTHPVWRAGLAWIAAELGHAADARRELDRLAMREFTDFPRDFAWLSLLGFLAEAVAFVGDASRAALLQPLLVPYGGRLIVGSVGVVCLGPVAYHLGLLAGVLGREDEAEGYFGAALETCTRTGARLHECRTQHAWARLLLARGGAGDRERAVALIRTALESAATLGLSRRAERLRALGGRNRARVASLPGTDDGNVFRREGDYWTIGFEGRVVRLRHSLGLAYLAQLLRHPGREFLAPDLVSTVHGRPGDDAFVDLGDGGVLLDAKARTAYRRQLDSLREQLDEAIAAADTARAGAVRSEMEFLTRELARGIGLGGRGRPAASLLERARVNVTRTIKDALRRLTEEHPDLGRHLTVTVRTGTYCAYLPDPRLPVTWKR